MPTGKADERHIIATLRARPEERDAVRSLLLELIGPSRREPGCLYYDLYQRQDAPDIFHLVDGWASDAAVVAHVAHPNVVRVTAKLTPLLAEPSSYTLSLRVSEPR